MIQDHLHGGRSRRDAGHFQSESSDLFHKGKAGRTDGIGHGELGTQVFGMDFASVFIEELYFDVSQVLTNGDRYAAGCGRTTDLTVQHLIEGHGAANEADTLSLGMVFVVVVVIRRIAAGCKQRQDEQKEQEPVRPERKTVHDAYGVQGMDGSGKGAMAQHIPKPAVPGCVRP